MDADKHDCKCEGMRLLLHLPRVPLGGRWVEKGAEGMRSRLLQSTRRETCVLGAEPWTELGGAKVNPGGGIWEGVLCVCMCLTEKEESGQRLLSWWGRKRRESKIR